MSLFETNHPQGQASIIADEFNELRELEMQRYQTAVRKGRNALFGTGGLLFFWEMVGMFRLGGFDPVVFSIALLEGGLFIGLAFWTYKKPYTAVLTGLIAFICIILLSVVVFGMQAGAEGAVKALVSGAIVKAVIIIFLAKALGDARALQAAKEERY